MDSELLLWVIVFVGGYSLVVVWLLSIALRKPGEEEGGGVGDTSIGDGSGGQTSGGGSPGESGSSGSSLT
jgi:hypothetical protein